MWFTELIKSGDFRWAIFWALAFVILLVHVMLIGIKEISIARGKARANLALAMKGLGPNGSQYCRSHAEHLDRVADELDVYSDDEDATEVEAVHVEDDERQPHAEVEAVQRPA